MPPIETLRSRATALRRAARERGLGEALADLLRGLVVRGGGALASEAAPLRDLRAIADELRARLDRAEGAAAEALAEALAARESGARVAGLEAEFAAARASEAALRGALAEQARVLEWLAPHRAGRPAPRAANGAEGPLVSVVLPVWNRAATVGEAIDGVARQSWPHWELVVVDDGSDDGSAEVVAARLADPRIRLVRQPHLGAPAARNRGLRDARGEIVAHLDSDDEWFPEHLSSIVAALERHPERDCVYTATLVSGPDGGGLAVVGEAFDRARLEQGNFVPMIAFAHRRPLGDAAGGFDESLRRLVDWDFVLRCADRSEPLFVPALTAHYRKGSWPRVSTREASAPAAHRIRRKRAAVRGRGVRVLYALEFFPHLSETYVGTEIAAMRAQGVEIEVWSERDPPVRGVSEVPVRRGSLERAIADTSPDLVHVHHLDRAARYLPAVAAAGLRMTVRAHAFEFTPERFREVASAPAVARVYAFPHLAPEVADKVVPMTACFDPETWTPCEDKDPRLVVRAGLATRTKDLGTFLRIAARCPRHRFVLAACASVAEPHHLGELRDLNRSLGSPVEIVENLGRLETRDLVRSAAIHLHTHARLDPFGMPISIAEAMATGAYTIARKSRAAAAYVGAAGAPYETEDEAVTIVRATEIWTPDDWRHARLVAVEHAWASFPAPDVVAPILEDWLGIAAGRRRAVPAAASIATPS